MAWNRAESAIWTLKSCCFLGLGVIKNCLCSERNPFVKKHILMLTAVIAILFTSPSASAQAVGSVVECAPTSRSDWRRGVVVENDPNKHYMRVRVEAENGKTGGVFMVARAEVRSPGGAQNPQNQGALTGTAGTTTGTVLATPSEPIHPRAQPSGNWFNAPQAAVQAPQQAEPQQPQHQQNPIAKQQTNPNCACAPMSDLSGDGMDGIFKREIRDVYIISGQDIASKNPATINFKSFQIGASRPYRMPEAWAYNTGSPDGPGGREGTTVYPVHARFTVCVDYPGYPKNGYMGRLAVKELDNTYWCFKNAFGKWQCNLGSPSKLLESKYIDK